MADGEEFGPYRLRRLLGRGGMGEVFEAYAAVQDRNVAVKRLLPHMADDADFQRRFRRESRMAARLSNPHVIPIHTYGEVDGRLFLEMRLIEGRDLGRALAEEGRLAPARAVSIVGQIGSALDAAHRAGLVHRDVKPSNILLDRDGGSEDFVYLADFGITRAVTGSVSQSLSSSHVIVGSLDYMAPEQFDGVAGPPADIYSLGCVLYQCLTGVTPFPMDSVPALLKAHIAVDPPRPSARRPELGTRFDAVIARALAKDPSARYATAAELTAAARSALVERTEDQGPSLESVSTVRATPRSDPPPAGATVPVRTPVPAAPPGTPPSVPPPGTVPPSAAPAGPSPADAPRGRSSRIAVVGLLLVVGLALGLIVGVLVDPSGSAPGASASPSANAPGPSPAQPAVPAAARSGDQPRVTAQFDVEGDPETVAVTPDGRTAYLTTTEGPFAVAVLDLRSGRVVANVPTPGPPYYVGLTPDGTRAYVTYYDRDRQELMLGVLDTARGAFTGSIPTGVKSGPGTRLTWVFGFAMSRDGTRIYVPNQEASVVSVLDTTTGRSIAQIPVEPTPHWVALAPDGRTAYVTNHNPGNLTVLDTVANRVAGTIPIGAGVAPHSVAVSPDGRLAEAVTYDISGLTMVDTSSNRVIATIPIGDEPQGVTFSPDGAHSYAVDEGGGDIAVLNTATRVVTARIPVGDGASAIALTPDGRTAVVTAKEAGKVTVLDLTA